MSGPRKFEMPFRPPYEYVSAAAWLAAIVASTYAMATSSLPAFPFVWTMPVAGAFLALRGYQGWNKHQELIALKGSPLAFIDHKKLHAKLQRKEVGESLWIGDGFDWGVDAAARAFEVAVRGPENLIKSQPIGGSHWIHAMGDGEDSLKYLSRYLNGHTGITGTTGSGKTRLLDLIVTQIAARGMTQIHPKTKSKREAIIIIDPKGDKGLYENAKKLCEDAGEPERFVYFHPAFPENSACIDVMRNFSSATELASRIAAIIPSETGNDPFVAFSWKSLNDICAGCLSIQDRPNLVKLRRYVEAGVGGLLERALVAHFSRHIPNWELAAAPYISKQKGVKIAGYIDYYNTVVAHTHHARELDGLINGFTHERTHYQKMTASLIPILTMLTSGHLADMLSPDPTKVTDRLCTDMSSIIAEGKVCYIGLNSLADGTIGSAIGSMFLSDLTACAGDRYNYGIPDDQPVMLVADEVGETINSQLIQILNKGRGAGFKAIIAFQTISDIVVRTGSEPAARKVLGNLNNFIALRITDVDTREFFAEKVGKTLIPTLKLGYRSGNSNDDPGKLGGQYTESLEQVEGYRIEPRLLSELPDLHYFAALADGRVIKSRIPVLVPR